MGTGKSLAAAALVVVLSATALGGCESIEKETGISKGGQKGALGGAAVGGVIAGVAGASPAWIAGSVILGAVAGGFLGDQFSKKDKEKHAQSSYQAFETKQEGEQTAWNNPESGNGGTTKIDSVYRTTSGQLCKDFSQQIKAGDKTQTTKGTTCQQSDGTWKVL